VKNIRADAEKKLPGYMVPCAYRFVGSVSIDQSGKADKKALPDAEASQMRTTQHESPMTETERSLAAIWKGTA
jgi:acyl-CoA synthetase (AMP-forming)/AMP-acid ligase II